MKIIKCSYKTIGFIYDFAVDGGAISSINTGLYLPINAQVISVITIPLITLVSGGACSITIEAPISNILLQAAYTTFNSTSTFGFSNSNQDTVATPIFMSIATATLTAGSFQFVINYVELD